MTLAHDQTVGHTTPRQATSTLLGVWPTIPSASSKRVRQDAVAGLVEMCVEQDVLPCGDPLIVTFSDRRDIMLAAYSLGIPIVELLNVAEKVGFGPRRLFVAASVPVRSVYVAFGEAA